MGRALKVPVISGHKARGEGVSLFPLPRANRNGMEEIMPILPDRAMVDVATRIIDLLGDTMAFQRGTSGAWEESASAVKVYLQPRDSFYRRSFRGMENSIDFAGFASAVADIQKGDRTAINHIYYIVDALENRGTHLEFRLRQTDEVQDL